MSTIELQPELACQPLNQQADAKLNHTSTTTHSSNQEPKTQQHPLHQYDLTLMSKFYESCVGKLKEQNPKWQPNEWIHINPMPSHLSWEQKYDWPNPMFMSQKQRVYESFARLARESGEPMILLPNFDYGDIMNFERFLQSLKQDGYNSIGKYKLYLNNKDMRKYECDLVVIHPRYGIMLFEVKDCDHFDSRRRNNAKMNLNNARSCFESMARLMIEAKGWSFSEARIPITEFIALPNVIESPTQLSQQMPTLQSANANTSSTSTSSNRQPKQMNYLIKSDLDSSAEFAKWWTRCVVEPRVQQQQQAELANKVNKFDSSLINSMVGLIHCIRNNSILPVVYPEVADLSNQQQQQHQPQENSEKKTETSGLHFQPALNVYGEFFKPEHEKCRSFSKCVLYSSDAEKIRKTICLQTLWLLLNDSQKKISVVCSELNKPYYEEFFARQRKIYNNLNNLRFYTNFHSCDVNGQHTLKNTGEVWIFDTAINGSLNDVFERAKECKSFWIFTEQADLVCKLNNEFNNLNAKCVNLDEQVSRQQEDNLLSMPWLSGASIKFPLRLQCDLLIIGDLISTNQTKLLSKFIRSNSVLNQSAMYHQQNQHHNNHYNQQQQQQQQYQQLKFNPSKRFKSVKFVRGGTIDNLRTSLKMHDSIQAPVILIHVGDEDLFKTRDSNKTIEYIKELSTLVKEYCPTSFVVLSTLMRRRSRTENGIINEVNKGIIHFCKQTKDQLNCFYMLNNHFEPNYHTQEGRQLNNKGLKLYMENTLFVVDYFLIRNNKQN